MQLVMLGGELGEKYGTEHEYYNLRTPADAIKLLCVNYPAFQKDLTEAHHNGIGYKVIQSGAAMGYEELHLPFGSRPLMVVPVISGSGGSTGQILLGVGLVAASFLLPGAGLFGTTSIFSVGALTTAAGTATLATTLGTALSAVGASLILSGTANLISPQPEVPRLGGDRLDGGTNARGTGPQGVTRGASGQQSYAFNGPTNTVGTGATIPVIYGRVITGGHLLSLDIDISDESDPLRKTLGGFNRNEVRLNDEKIRNQYTTGGGLETRKFTDKQRVVFSTDDNRRVAINKTFGGRNTEGLTQLAASQSRDLKLKNETLEYRDSKALLQRLDVVFELENSLYDYVGNENSTIIDGFITYSIVFKYEGIKGHPVVASGNATLQGKFKSTSANAFYYGHRFEVPKAGSADNIKMEFRITDASVAKEVTLKLIGYGYDLL